SFVVVCFAGTAHADPVDFQRDVRPLFSRHCFKCHGPDDKARKAKLRLDMRAAATKGGRSGLPAVAPGKPDDSGLVRRIFADEAEVMPPPPTRDPLSDSQKQLLRRCIAEGADYKPHWAFVARRQASLRKVKQGEWPRNPIDYFVLARLEAAGLRPAPEADRYKLVRRLYLDLIGLPPTPEEADAFVRDIAPDAYDRLVERLLASPHYGAPGAARRVAPARLAAPHGY